MPTKNLISRHWTIEDQYRESRDHGWRAKGLRKNKDGNFSNVEDFINSGAMQQIEYIAAAEAAQEAKQFEREIWLPRLEKYLSKWESEHPKGEMLGDLYGGRLRQEIKRLRRVLKIHKGSDEERAAVRERVRKSRERQRAGWTYQGSIHYRPPDENKPPPSSE